MAIIKLIGQVLSLVLFILNKRKEKEEAAEAKRKELQNEAKKAIKSRNRSHIVYAFNELRKYKKS